MVENRIKARRTELGMTQEQLAKAVGAGQSTIAEIESNKHEPELETALRLAKALNSPLTDLFWLSPA